MSMRKRNGTFPYTCRECDVAFRVTAQEFEIEGNLVVRSLECPGCDAQNIFLTQVGSSNPEPSSFRHLWPLSPSPELKLDRLIPTKYQDEVREALGVLDVSPKSSAALSRRLLQRLLREELRIKSAPWTRRSKRRSTRSTFLRSFFGNWMP